jgi:N-acetylmuramoyl-L-alanine amidase
MSIVVIDPGHGGSKSVGGSSPNNAVSPSGLLEKDLTLDIALRLAPLVEARGHQVFLTRDTDVNAGLSQRAQVARDREAVAFLSIHLNGFDGRVQGTETFVHSNSGEVSTALAKFVQRLVLAVTAHPDRGVKRAGFGVLSPSVHLPSTAACLVELSFMDVPQEERRLTGDSYRQGLAEALDAALGEYLTLGVVRRVRGASDDRFEPEPEPEDGFEVIVR